MNPGPQDSGCSMTSSHHDASPVPDPSDGPPVAVAMLLAETMSTPHLLSFSLPLPWKFLTSPEFVRDAVSCSDSS